MSIEVLKALVRIETDIAMIRRLIGAPQQPTKVVPKKGNTAEKVVIPKIAASYTPEKANEAHQQIERAYEAGLITYDKKRGMKMLVTKAIIGWTPDKKKAA